MKKIISLTAIMAALICSSSFSHNLKDAKTYIVECPNPQMIKDNISWHDVNSPAISFSRSRGQVTYPWMPPELTLSEIVLRGIDYNKVIYNSYTAKVIGQQVECVYQTSIGPIVLPLRPVDFYINPKILNDNHVFQITQ